MNSYYKIDEMGNSKTSSILIYKSVGELRCKPTNMDIFNGCVIITIYAISVYTLKKLVFIDMYLNPENYLRTTAINYYLIPILNCIVLFHLTIFITLMITHSKSKLLIKFVHWLIIAMSTILTIPITTSTLANVYCHQNSPYYHTGANCYDTTHIFLMILGIINFLWMVLINLYFSLFYFTHNPFQETVLATSSNLWNIGQLVIKITPMMFLIIDYDLIYGDLYLFGVAALPFLQIGIFRFLYPFYHLNFKADSLNICIITGYCSLNVIFSIAILLGMHPSRLIELIYSIIQIIPLGILGVIVFKNFRNKLILNIGETNKQILPTLEQLIRVLMKDIGKYEYWSRLYFLKLHHRKCNDLHCICHCILKRTWQQEESKRKSQDMQLMICIIDNIVRVNKSANSFRLMKAYILNYEKKSKISGAFTLILLLQDKLDYSDQLMMVSLIQNMRVVHQESMMKNYLQFSQLLSQLQQLMIQIASLHEQYWQQLIQRNSSINKLMHLLDKIHRYKSNLQQLQDRMQQIFPNHQQTLLLLSKFHLQVSLQIKKSYIYYQKLKLKNKEQKVIKQRLSKQDGIGFRQQQNLVTIRTIINQKISQQGLQSSLQIINVSNNVNQLLGYNNLQLISRNLNIIIPKIYHQKHLSFVKQYLKLPDYQIRPKQILIYPINIDRRIVQCRLISRITVSLQFGIIISSCIQKTVSSKDQYLLIYDETNGNIDSLSLQAQLFFQKGKHTNTTKLNIEQSIQQLIPVWDYQKHQLIQNEDLHNKFEREYSKRIIKAMLVRRDQHICVLKLFMNENQKCQQTQSNVVSDEAMIDSRLLALTNLKISLNKLLTVNQPIEKNRVVQQIKNKSEYDNEQKYSFQFKIKIFFTVITGFLWLIIVIICVSQFSILISSTSINDDFQLLTHISNSQQIIIDVTSILSELTSAEIQNSNVSQLYLNLQKWRNVLLKKATILNNDLFSKQNHIKPQNGQLLTLEYFFNREKSVQRVQTALDSTFQFLTYLTEIIETSKCNWQNPNMLFISRNGPFIIAQFYQQLFQVVFKQTQKTLNKNFSLQWLLSFSKLILIIFCSCSVLIYARQIFNQIHNIFQKYKKININSFRKYPIKCSNFIRNLLTKHNDRTIRTRLSINPKHMGNHALVKIKDLHKHIIEIADQSAHLIHRKITYQNVSFLIIPSYLQYCKYIIAWFIIFIGVFLGSSALKNNNNQMVMLTDFTDVLSIRNQMSRIKYLSIEMLSISKQWNQTQVQNIRKILLKQVEVADQLISTNIVINQIKPQIFAFLSSIRQLLQENENNLQKTLILKKQPQAISKNLTQSVIKKINIRKSQIENQQITILKIVIVVQIIILLMFAKLNLLGIYHDTNNKWKNSKRMIKILPKEILTQI